jgi:transcription elongation factor Elf1
LTELTRNATFNPSDPPQEILRDLACPVCGHEDLSAARNSITANKLRTFCDSCGAFITVTLTEEQIGALRGCLRDLAS